MKRTDCKQCQLYSGSLYLPCAVHPTDPAPDGCLDFAPNAAAALEEEDDLWFPDNSGWYVGEPAPTPSFTLTIQESWTYSIHCSAKLGRDLRAGSGWETLATLLRS